MVKEESHPAPLKKGPSSGIRCKLVKQQHKSPKELIILGKWDLY